jgi:hypothetical protein
MGVHPILLDPDSSSIPDRAMHSLRRMMELFLRSEGCRLGGSDLLFLCYGLFGSEHLRPDYFSSALGETGMQATATETNGGGCHSATRHPLYCSPCTDQRTPNDVVGL